jgi:hypothetical protein
MSKESETQMYLVCNLTELSVGCAYCMKTAEAQG